MNRTLYTIFILVLVAQIYIFNQFTILNAHINLIIPFLIWLNSKTTTFHIIILAAISGFLIDISHFYLGLYMTTNIIFFVALHNILRSALSIKNTALILFSTLFLYMTGYHFLYILIYSTVFPIISEYIWLSWVSIGLLSTAAGTVLILLLNKMYSYE